MARLKYLPLNSMELLLVIYSLTILGEGIGGPLVKSSLRITLNLLAVILVFRNRRLTHLAHTIILYIVVITIPFFYSIIRGSFLSDSIQYLMYLNCIFFIHCYSKKRPYINSKEIFLISFPIVILFFVGGVVLNSDLFWRETFSDNAIRLGGLLINPNELGLLSAILILSGYDLFRNSIYKRVLLVLMGLLVLYLTQSRSGLIALIIAIFFTLDFRKKIIVSVLLISIILIRADILLSALPRADSTSDVISLTGRLITWKSAFSFLIPKYWLFGAGFQQYPGGSIGIGAEMAHNTFIQLWVGGGILSLILGVYLTYLVWSRYNGIMKSVMVVVLINAMTEFGFFGLFNHSVLVFTVLAIGGFKSAVIYDEDTVNSL